MMEVSVELKKWVDSLTMGEKRFIRLLGNARARGQDSQRLALLDWIETAAIGDHIPENASFAKNLPFVSDRLKDLILDGLHLLHKHADVEAQLRTAVDETALLCSKGLFGAAFRTLKRGKKLALSYSRYSLALHFLEWERKIIIAQPEAGLVKQLQALATEERQVMAALATLQTLESHHALLRIHEDQVFAPRNTEMLERVKLLVMAPAVSEGYSNGNYLERALATHILGIYDMLLRNPVSALKKYRALLEEWQTAPQWQKDQGPLVLSICNFFQAACFYTSAKWEDAQELLRLLPSFEFLSPQESLNYQRKVHVYSFLLALNTGNFESVRWLIPTVDGWLAAHSDSLTPAQILPFLNNFAVCEFILGNYSSANRYVQRILNLPNRKAREDIRNFALVLQAILQYELGDSELNAYLTRAAKRHFQKSTRALDFEMAVFRFLEKTLRLEHTDAMAGVLDGFIEEIEALAEEAAPGSLPVLGMMEVRLWARARQRQLPLREVFLEAVRENMEALGV